MIRFVVFGFCLLLIICSCKSKFGTFETTGPIVGKQTIYCDENLKKLVIQQEEIFESKYKYAEVNLSFENEQNLFYQLIKDSFPVIIASRCLHNDEIELIKKQMVTPRQWEIGRGAIVLVSNLNSQVSNITYEDLIQLCKAENAQGGFSKLVIENVNSGIAQHLLGKIDQNSFGKNVFSLKDKESIFQYLRTNKDALSAMDWSEFSDSDELDVQARLAEFKIIGVSRPADSTQYGFLKPYQYNLQDKKYPFCRDLYVISRSGQDDIGLGFASFIAGEIGQKILLKTGLLPKYQSERLIELNDQGVRVIGD